MKRGAVLSAFVWVTVLVAAQQQHFDGKSWWHHIEILADDKMEGRGTGTPGLERAEAYVVDQLRKSGLDPAGTSGYYQPIRLEARQVVESDSSASLVRNGKAEPLALGEDAFFAPLVDLAPKAEAPLVFLGYGINVPEKNYNDFAGLDLKGKVAVTMPGTPEGIDGHLAAHPALAEGLTSLAMLLIAQHQYNEAESLLRRASEIDRHNYAADDPKIAADLSNRAALAVARKRYAEAEELLAHADAILTKRLPADHPEIGKVMASLAEIRSRQLRWEESEELYERAVKILEQAWGSENPQLLSTLESYSRVLRVRQDYSGAERMDLRTTKIRVVQTLRASD